MTCEIARRPRLLGMTRTMSFHTDSRGERVPRDAGAGEGGTFVMRVSTRRVRELRHQRGTAVPGCVHGRDAHATPNNWHLLRDRRLGLKFRRQYPIENYVVDFYCSECRLAIELDGGAHSQPSQTRKDAAKDVFLGRLGIGVLRLPNGLVREDPDGFVRKVRDAAATRRRQSRKKPTTPHPSVH